MGERSTFGGQRWGWADLWVVGVPLALLYVRTASRDLGTIDSGELAVVCARLGVAHPSGYPLYTAMGRIAVMLWPGQPIVAVTLLSAAIAVAVAVALAALAREAAEDLGLPRWSAWAAALWFGCDRVFWEQATGNEVYGLHLLFVALLLRQGIGLMRPRAGGRDLLLLAYLIGLAFAHHLSSAFLLPALALAFAFYGARPGALKPGGPAAPRLLLASAGLAALAWSAVLILPVRSLQGPILDWGAPHVWDRFWRHALASQYRVWMFESGSLWFANLGTYLRALPSRLWWPLLALAIPGTWWLARRAARRLLFLALAGVITMFWASSYDIHDIETYFLPADLVIALLAAFGAAWLDGWIRSAGERRSRLFGRARPLAVPVVAGVLAAAQLGLHFHGADQRNDHFIRANVETLLGGLPPRTILLTRHWDAVVSAALYLQEIEKLRRDVTVVDVELLRRSWDYAQLRRWDPDLLRPLEDRVARFQAQVVRFERKQPYDPATIETAYREVIEGIALFHRPERPTAFTPDVEGSFLDHASPVPEGLAFVLYEDPAASPPQAPPDVDRILKSGYRPSDDIHRQALQAWEGMITARIRYLQAYHRTAEIPPWQAALERLNAALRP